MLSFLWHSRQKCHIYHFVTKCDKFWYRKWIEREGIKRKWGNVESESLSIFSFSLHSLASRMQGCSKLCNPSDYLGTPLKILAMVGIWYFAIHTFFSGKNSWKSQNTINTSKVFLVNLLVFPSQLQGEDPPAETKSHFWPQFFLDGAPNESSLLVVTSLQIWRGVFVRVLTYRHNKRKYAKIKTMMMELVLTRHTDDSCSWSGCDCPHTSLRCLLHPI